MATKAQSAPGAGAGGQRTARRPRTATVHLPYVTAEFRAPEIHLPAVRLPQRQDLNDAVSVVRPYLPSPQRAGLYAGLAAMGVLELIEWPVALAIAAATAITRPTTGSRPAAPEAAAGRDDQGAATTRSTTSRGSTSRSTASRSSGSSGSSAETSRGTAGRGTASRGSTSRSTSRTTSRTRSSAQRAVPRQRSAQRR